ncbi:hypothetical protein, partial [Methylocystis sp.]|uniref:hypothetical protein n=1 Tax=Methylocystis sp. TaxID=1911079 RepID=UPI003DA3704C
MLRLEAIRDSPRIPSNCKPRIPADRKATAKENPRPFGPGAFISIRQYRLGHIAGDELRNDRSAD